jgi:hypothetical protein
MKVLKMLWLTLLSERGGTEGIEGQGGETEGSVETQQADQAGSTEQDVQAQEQGQPIDPNVLTKERDDWRTKHETLSGQARATERNLAATRRALEAKGFRMVQDSDGNVQLVPVSTQQSSSKFTDQHKAKFFSYFPDEKSGEGFLDILNVLLEDKQNNGFKSFREQMGKEQEFYSGRQQAIDRMFSLFPALNPKGTGFNKSFYERADQILLERYWDREGNKPLFPNADLIAANEAAIELGISPSTIAAAKKEGFDKARQNKTIVGTAQGSQSQTGTGGFRKLSFEEYQKLPMDKRQEYDRGEVESRKVK